MAKSILIPTLISASNIDALNRSFIADADVDNGNVFVKGALSAKADESQVYEATAATAATEKGIWMAFSPEDNIITDAAGNQYKVGNLDPRGFTNVAGTVFSGFQPKVGDLVTISADGIAGSANDYAILDGSTMKLTFAAAQGDGAAFKVIETTYISVASANAIGSQRVTAYLLECVAN